MHNYSKLFEYINSKKNSVSKRTFEDLNLKEVFYSINFTNSKIGEQYLFYILNDLKSNYEEFKFFEENRL